MENRAPLSAATLCPLKRDRLMEEKPSWLWSRYGETPGLEVYRSSERYSVWWHHHQQLLKAEPTYVQETRRYSLMIWGSSLFACLLFLRFAREIRAEQSSYSFKTAAIV